MEFVRHSADRMSLREIRVHFPSQVCLNPFSLCIRFCLIWYWHFFVFSCRCWLSIFHVQEKSSIDLVFGLNKNWNCIKCRKCFYKFFFWWMIVGRIIGFCRVKVCSIKRFELFVHLAYSKPGIQVHALTGLSRVVTFHYWTTINMLANYWVFPTTSFVGWWMFASTIGGDPTVIPSVRRKLIRFSTVPVEIYRVLQTKSTYSSSCTINRHVEPSG